MMPNSNQPGGAPGFRQDINGLRAWAVLLVMLYHFGVPGVSGGFAGVDIFFVISGFLMSGIILRGRAAGRFSLAGFYLARARRIVPALAAMCAGVLLFGWFWLGAADYRTLAQHAQSAVLFYSSQVFAGEAGYFDAAATEKWLLHTWSLSIEWQFYLVYPLLLVWLTRWLSVANLMLALLLVSLTYSLLLAGKDASQAFYSFPARMWELLAGGLAYVHAERVQGWKLPRWLLEAGGFALIAFTLSFADAANWPGPMVLLPVAGAVMILLAARQDSWLTGHAAMQALGRWSYSVYLWHWPLLVAAVYLGFEQNAVLTLLLFAASIGAGALSYRHVEERFWHRRPLRWRGVLLMVAGVAAVSALIAWGRGVPARLPEALAKIEEQMLVKETDVLKRATGQIECGWNRKTATAEACRYGAQGVPARVLVWGDSHANKTMLSIHEAASKSGLGIELYYRNGCRPVRDYVFVNGNYRLDCTRFNAQVMQKLAASPHIETVILISDWPDMTWVNGLLPGEPLIHFGDLKPASRQAQYEEFNRRLVEGACSIRRMGKRVLVAAPLPDFGVNVPRYMARSFIERGEADVPTLPLVTHQARNRELLDALHKAQRDCGVEMLDMQPVFCAGGICRAAHDGVPLYSDDNHLSMHANELLLPLMQSYFAPAASRQ